MLLVQQPLETTVHGSSWDFSKIIPSILSLCTLLLGSHDSETAIVFLLRSFLEWTFLRNLIPATSSTTSTTIMRTGTLWWHSVVHQALVGKLLSSNELFSKVTRVNGIAAAMHSFRNDVCVRSQ